MIKKILIGVATLLVLVIIFGVLQALLVPKYISNPEGALTGEYYADKGGHDVIFVGDCEVYESFVPSVLNSSFFAAQCRSVKTFSGKRGNTIFFQNFK